jgi:plastocyanin
MRTMRILKLGVCLLAVWSVSAGCQSETTKASAQTPVTGTEIKIDNFSFGPEELTVPAGATVTWTNHDDIPHLVTSDDNIFKSKALDTDDRFSYTFTKPGTYPYYCSVHPKMTGKIVVQ